MHHNNLEKILICDFGASLKHTHHLQFIISNIKFVRRNYARSVVGVILPIASELNPKVLNYVDFSRKILLPIFFFPKTNIRLLATWLTFIWRRFGQTVLNQPKFYLFLSVILVLPYFMFCRANLVVFPTACAQSLKLTEILEFFRVKKSFHLHFSNTSEIRAPYGSTEICEEFIKKSINFKYVKIIFSFDTPALLESYSDLNKKLNFYLARPPSTNNLELLPTYSPTSTRLSIVRVLIMGRATDPGRDALIVKSLKEFKNLVKDTDGFKDQIYEFSATLEDSSLIQVINDNSPDSFRFKKLHSNLDFIALVELLKTATVVVLPYDPKLYSKNHSGMVLLLSDLKIPMVVCDGAAFSPEVLEFNLGELFNYKSSFANSLVKVLNRFNDSRFTDYFQAREKENIYLLNHLNVGQENRSIS